jgi:hypothetical protein
LEDNLKNRRQLKKKGKEKGRQPNKIWKTNQSTKINLIGCDTIVNSHSFRQVLLSYDKLAVWQVDKSEEVLPA